VPFTPTHALAAVPLSRVGGTLPSALAIGCVLPDLPMFIPGAPSYATTHSLVLGVPSCLPYGILAFVLFRLCRGPALGFAPLVMRRRLGHYAAADLRLTPALVGALFVSIALGVLSHIVWDSFTHAHRLGSELVPVLSVPWVEVGGYAIPGYRLLQHGSSVVGLPLLVMIVVRWYRRQPLDAAPAAAAAPRALSWLALSLIVAVPLLAGAIAYFRAMHAPHHFLTAMAYHAVTMTIGGYVVVAVLVTLPQRVLK